MSVGRQVARHRRALGLTQDAFAAKLRVTAQYVSMVERGVENLGIDSLTKLANALGCRVRDLFEPVAAGEGPRPGRPRSR